MNRAFDLTGRVALVTGASRGIGRAIALELGEAGAAVAVHYAGQAEAAADTASRIARSCIVQANLAEADAPERILARTHQELGDPDIIVANASVQYRRNWDQYNPGEFDDQINVNLRSVMRLVQLAVPAMSARKWGRILTIGSVQQHRPHPQMLTYAATKAAIENLCRNLAKQLGIHGITVNNLAPGVILTDRNRPILENPDYARQLKEAIPLRDFGRPEDCAGAALLLCSDAGRYITGIDLLVDGGLRLP